MTGTPRVLIRLGLIGGERRAGVADLSADRMAGALRIAPANGGADPRDLDGGPLRRSAWRRMLPAASSIVRSIAAMPRGSSTITSVCAGAVCMRRIARSATSWTGSPSAPATELDPSCTAAGPERTFLLWGDSFAQALSLGLREQLPPGTALAQVATSACVAAVDDFDMSVRDGDARKPTVMRWTRSGDCGRRW